MNLIKVHLSCIELVQIPRENKMKTSWHSPWLKDQCQVTKGLCEDMGWVGCPERKRRSPKTDNVGTCYPRVRVGGGQQE